MPKPAVINIPSRLTDFDEQALRAGEETRPYVAMLAARRMFEAKTFKTEIVDNAGIFLPEFHDHGVKIFCIVDAQGYSLPQMTFETLKRRDADVLLWTDINSYETYTKVSFMGWNSFTEFDLSKQERELYWAVDLCLPMARIMAFLGDKQR